MKKLIGFAVAVLFSVVTVFASVDGVFKSAIYDNVVNDICVVGNKVYTATNGGVEVFSKDGKNLPGESTPWKVYTTVNSNLPRNFVHSIVADTIGNIWAMGNGWFSCFAGNMSTGKADWVGIGGVQSAEDIAMGPDGVRWAIMTFNSKRGLYRDGGMGYQFITLPQDISDGIYRIAVGGYGHGPDSAFCTVWMTWSKGISRYDAISGKGKVWRIGNELIAGSPLNIAVSGETVIAGGESGAYIFTSDTASSPWVLAYSSEMPQNNGGVVTYLWGLFYLGQRDGSLWVFNSGWKRISIPAGTFSMINCLANDGVKLYLGTDNKMWVYDGVNFTQKSVTGIRYPHDNNILHINRDNTGRILVGGFNGGYRYDVDASSPSLNSSAQNVSGEVFGSFVDNIGALWIGRDGYIERNGIKVNLPYMPSGLNNPYWLVGGVASSASNMWLVTSNPVSLQVYAGEGTWGHPLDAPAQLAKEKILSASSTGKRLWIATDSSLYSYDFFGNWTYKRLHYSSVRYVCAENWRGNGVYVADGGYTNGSHGVTYYNVVDPSISNVAWPLLHNANHMPKPNCIYVDKDSIVWLATDSGAYYLDRKSGVSIWQAVPLRNSGVHTLADDHVNTIYVDSVTNAVWFGTAGGLTVWNRPISTSVKPAFNPLVKTPALVVGQNIEYFDISGRKISSNSLKNLARGQIVFRKANGVITKMSMNFNQLR